MYEAQCGEVTEAGEQGRRERWGIEAGYIVVSRQGYAFLGA